VAPSGKGPGGGRFRDAWIGQVVQALGLGGVPTFHPRVQVTPEEIQKLRRAGRTYWEGGWGAGRSARFNKYDAQRRRFVARHGEGAEALEQRVFHEESVEYEFGQYAQRHGIEDPEAFKRELADRLRRLWADKKVAIRIDKRSLELILADRRYRTIHEENEQDIRGFGLISGKERGFYEEFLWGYDEDSDPEIRPVYGYLVGAGNDEAVEKYGDIQLVLKDSVRPRTTAMYGDSLDHMSYGMPSAVDNPGWQSWTFGTGTDDQDELFELDRTHLTGDIYVEAQIHGGVQLRDIERIVFPYEPPTATQRLLRAKRIPWSVE